MSSDPGAGQNVDALVSSAVERLNRGELDTAEVYCRQALALHKGHLGALTVLGSVMHSLARFREAESLFTELTDRAPDSGIYWTNLGTTRRATGKFDAALAAFARAAELGEKSADFLYNLGLTHLERHDHEAARQVLSQAIALAPADAEIRLEYARACQALSLDDEAIAALLGCAQDDGVAAHLQARIGLQLLQHGETGAAQAIASRLSGSSSLEPRALLILAQIHERMNRIDEAGKLLARVKSDPRTLAQAVNVKSFEARLLQRANLHAEAAELLRGELSRTRESPLRHHDLFALAKSLDALGRFDESFATIDEAHRSQLANMPPAVQRSSFQLSRPMLLAQRGVDPADVASWEDQSAPDAEHSPIFVAGAPNSGKVLIELMLDAHPQLKASEGRPLMNAVMTSWGTRYPHELAGLGSEQLTAAREKYWQAARRKLRLTQGQRLIDTDPMNLVQLPAMLRLFPHAPVIFVRRHPCDTLLSAYMQDFASADLVVLSANLNALAHGYDKAMSHWVQQCEPLAPHVHEVAYEQLTEDFASRARLLLDAVGVPWHDAVLRPDLHARAKGSVASTSYDDAVLPVANRSVGHWVHYAAHFERVLPVLRVHAQRWNYSLQA